MKTLPALLVLATLAVTTAAQAATRGPLPSEDKPDLGKGAAERDVKQENAEPVKSTGATKQKSEPKESKEQKGDRLFADKADDIARVENFLSTISSIVANFSQTSADGSSGTGKFFMKRPGKMRWQYNPPMPILIVSDGKTVSYYDAGLDQVSYIGVDDTLAGFLARKVIKLDSESTALRKFENANGTIRATIVQKKKPDEGSLTLLLSDKPMELKGMVVTDATGNATTVNLDNAQYGPVLDDKLFVFIDPRNVNRKRNKR